MREHSALTTVGVALVALCGRLPGRRYLGGGMGRLAMLLMRRRRHIAEKNLRAAMPDLSDAERARLLRRQFTGLGQLLMDILWALSADRQAICRHIRIEGELPTPCILLAPHFIGADLALLRLNLFSPVPVYYHHKPMHNAFWNHIIKRLRERYGAIGLPTSTRLPLLTAVRQLRRGNVFCYLPDIDPKARKSTVYVSFMGVPRAATTTALSRLARAARVPVVPAITCRSDDGGYVLRLLPPLTDYPGDHDEDDAQRTNMLIGEWVRQQPQNYFWLHRRFKTVAAGDSAIY